MLVRRNEVSRALAIRVVYPWILPLKPQMKCLRKFYLRFLGFYLVLERNCHVFFWESLVICSDPRFHLTVPVRLAILLLSSLESENLTRDVCICTKQVQA